VSKKNFNQGLLRAKRGIHTEKIAIKVENDFFVHFRLELSFLFLKDRSGLPDFSWYNIPKTGGNIPNYHKLYQNFAKWL
jgi:hypothetical protein